MPVLRVSLVFRPEFPELLDDFIVPANLLVDDKQHGIEGEHSPEHHPCQFCFHARSPKKRTTGKKDPTRPLSLSVRWWDQASAGTVSAQVSTAVRIASSE